MLKILVIVDLVVEASRKLVLVVGSRLGTDLILIGPDICLRDKTAAGRLPPDPGRRRDRSGGKYPTSRGDSAAAFAPEVLIRR